jgi:hypothetical protein
MTYIPQAHGPRSTGFTVFDAAVGEKSPSHGFTGGHLNVRFRRTARDAKACRKVPVMGDPPADLEARRALAAAGNPGVKDRY